MKKILCQLFILFTLFGTQINYAGVSPLFSVTSSGNILQIKSVANHSYPAAGIRINTPGYIIANMGTDCTPYSNGYCLFPVNNTVAKSITLSGPSGPINVTLCLNGYGPLSCQNYTLGIKYTVGGTLIGLTSGSVVLQNNGSNNVTLSTNGPFSFSTPVATGQTYDVTVETQPPFQMCRVTNGSGIMGNASISNIVVQCHPTNAYVTNFEPQSPNSTLSICPINPDGSFAPCTPVDPNNTLDKPTSITMNRARTLAYITNYFNDTVSVCHVTADGQLNACVSQTNAGFSNVIGVALSANEATAFVVNANVNSGLYACPLNPATGLFQLPCTLTGNGFDRPNGIVLNNSGTLAYITNGNNNSVSLCPVINNELFGSCSITSNNFDIPIGITLNNQGTKAYIANLNNNTVSVCDVNTSTGALINCVQSNPNTTFTQPTGIALNSLGTIAYVGNYDNSLNHVSRCQVAIDGSLSSCVVEQDPSFNKPYGLFVTN